MKARLDKILADSGLGTRSSVRNLIKSGKIKVNDVTQKDPGRKVDTDKDRITYGGEDISYSEMVYYMLNKPAGVITATEDKNQKTVLDLITDKKRRDLFPVGRLDKDTVGLLLITNDGALSHRLLAPGKHVAKKYLVRVDGIITEEVSSAICSGVDIGDDKPTAPAELDTIKQIEDTDAVIYEAVIKITEGRYHQIKRMFEAFGLNVIYLKRLSMGSLTLDPDLKEGEWRYLTDEEIKKI
ncbi:MAG: rRNA pseudouridine synthase [Eubacterium sp.]|nr:rRNA pseudouridine synthase [Eubacterium sp.]